MIDDPEPVPTGGWEIDLASQAVHDEDGTFATLPHLDINCGLLPSVEVHLLAPLDLNAPAGGPRKFGCGDTEFGIKCRLAPETASHPAIGGYPTVELPSGNETLGLGGGISAGVDVVRVTSSAEGEGGATPVNIGLDCELDRVHHLVVGFGRPTRGPSTYQAYFGFQFRLGQGR